MKNKATTFFQVFVITAAILAFMWAVFTVDVRSAVLVGNESVAVRLADKAEGAEKFFNGVGRFYGFFRFPHQELIGSALYDGAFNLVNAWGLSDFVRDYGIELLSGI